MSSVRVVKSVSTREVEDLRSGRVSIIVVKSSAPEDIDKFGLRVSQEIYKRGEGEAPIMSVAVGSDEPKSEIMYVKQDTEVLWHHDKGFSIDVANFAGLRCLAADEGSSPTLFSDMKAAYIHAPMDLKEAANDLTCLNSFAKYMDTGLYPLDIIECRLVRLYKMKARSHHPLVKEINGEKFFYFSEAYTIAPQDLDERLATHCWNGAFTYEHFWEPGDLVIWNNLTLTHKRLATDPKICRRHLRYALV